MRLFLLIGLTVLMPLKVHASEQITKLDKDNIHGFVQFMTDLAQPDSGLSSQDIQEALDQHLFDKGVYKSTITYKIPGFPETPKTMGLNKQQFMQNVIDGKDKLQDYTSSTTLTSTKIDRDGKTATIKTTGEESGTMPMQGSEHVPFTGTSRCTQHIKISDLGYIQIISADCKTEFRF